MFSTIHLTTVRWIAPPVLTWTILSGGSAYGQMPLDSAPIRSDLATSALAAQTQAANVHALLADLRGLAG